MNSCHSVVSSLLLTGIVSVLLSSPASAAILLAGSDCPHIKVLEKQDSGQVREEYRELLGNPGSTQMRYLARAADLLPPLLCQAVRRVAFVDLAAEPGVNGWSMANEAQDLIYLNSAQRAMWNNSGMEGSPTAQALAIQNFVHESSHAAVRLLQSQQKNEPPPGVVSGIQVKLMKSRPESSLWSKAASEMAKAVIADMGLDNGIIREWIRLHESFRLRGLAGRYYGDEWDDEGMEELDHAANGFTSSYGGQAPIEDIAELTGWAITAHLFTGGAQPSYKGRACKALRRRGEVGIPDGLEAIFSKLDFLQRMGMIDEQSFVKCTGRGRPVGF